MQPTASQGQIDQEQSHRTISLSTQDVGQTVALHDSDGKLLFLGRLECISYFGALRKADKVTFTVVSMEESLQPRVQSCPLTIVANKEEVDNT